MHRTHDIAAIHRRFRAVGSALMRINANNTHSGNMSLRDPFDPNLFYITASGSQCGALAPEDIVPVRLSDLSRLSAARPSTESNTHRRVMSLPEANACVHSHSIASTLITFDSPENPVFLSTRRTARSGASEYLFQPLDFFGAGLIGPVGVGFHRRPVGSLEIEEHIAACLRKTPVALVAGHGPFARGRTLEQCLHYLSVLENSAILAVALRRRGIDIARMQRALTDSGFERTFPFRPRTYEADMPTRDQEANSSSVADFAAWLAYNYNLGLGAYGTGSMSRKVAADHMLFCPMSAVPEGLGFPLDRLPLTANGPEPLDVRLHRLIYTHTRFTACVLTTSPLATAEGTAVLAAAQGQKVGGASTEGIVETSDRQPVVVPIDAEAKYYRNRLAVVEADSVADESPDGPILTSLNSHGPCCIIARYGLIAVGEKGLDQAVYNASAAERTARFRQEAYLNQKLCGGPPVSEFE
jgi:L-fuculose-phosphate aldolase